MRLKGVANITMQSAVTKLKEKGLIVSKHKRNYICLPKGVEPQRKLICFLAVDLANPFFAGIAKHLEAYANKQGYELALASSNYDARQERDKLEMFCRMNARGIIVCPWANEENQDFFANLPVPFVLIGRRMQSLRADAVLVNGQIAAQSVATHFKKLGFAHFAYIGPAGIKSDPRLSGFRNELLADNFSLNDENILLVDNQPPIHTDPIEVFIKRMAAERAAVFCFHDLFAVRALHACHKLHLAVPEHIAIAGFDNLSIASQVSPQLTSVGYPLKDMAHMSFDILLTSNESREKNACYLESKLIVRQSTCADVKPEVVDLLYHSLQEIK
jgi:LacI family transcriptional regulator